ncbi:hypothetical protein D3C83_279980 [compost metagenome]
MRLRLAERHLADGAFDAALEHLVEIVRTDRGDLRDQARRTMLEIFKLAADQPELVTKYRRMLSSALY